MELSASNLSLARKSVGKNAKQVSATYCERRAATKLLLFIATKGKN